MAKLTPEHFPESKVVNIKGRLLKLADDGETIITENVVAYFTPKCEIVSYSVD